MTTPNEPVLRRQKIIVDLRADPLVFVRWTAIDLVAATEFIDWVESRFASEASYALAMTFDGAPKVSNALRTKVSGWMRDRADEIVRYNIAQSYLVDGRLKRMLLRSILTVGRNKVPYNVVLRLAETESFLRKHLEAASISAPSTPADWGKLTL